ncbi:MAG: DUF3800 domain-containing protein [Clostridium sp.]|nr:DUF3800 domain-containing protein [Clostridium sp.]MCM1173120.1 DUF3800 domain-containing protein [Clostridium sp.]MCM1208940.1 DUF3800 domain-containing protein [Ruminococcus sp.]
MKELSIFVDESGDWGEYDFHSPYYIISMVIHDQSSNITENLKQLEKRLSDIGYPHHTIHSGPIIRSENEYKGEDIVIRQKIIKSLMAFIRNSNIKFKTFYIEKKHIEDSVVATGKLSKQIASFIRDNFEYFFGYGIVKVYYDNGQVEVTRILSSVFNSLLDNVEFRKVTPSDYRLFQVADLICTLRLIELKLENHALSKSENAFFITERILKKNYLKPIQTKRM